MRPRVGVSACFFHADPQRAIFKGKTLLYAEESMLTWIMSGGALPVLLPRPHGDLGVDEIVESVDGLVLQGGSDVAPESYGALPIRPEWAGDAARDHYEMALVRACLARGKPLLGVCRGAQILNVTLGGTLFQDIETLHPGRRVHRDWKLYDQLAHQIEIQPGSLLEGWYTAAARPVAVNSVHHQGLDRLGEGLVVEARSVPDGIVEAVRYGDRARAFAYGVQWHPEFIFGAGGACLLDPQPLLDAFLNACLAAVDGRRGRPFSRTPSKRDP